MGTRLIAYEIVTRPSELVKAVSWLQLVRSWKSRDFIQCVESVVNRSLKTETRVVFISSKCLVAFSFLATCSKRQVKKLYH